MDSGICIPISKGGLINWEKSPEYVLKAREIPTDKEKIATYLALYDMFWATTMIQNVDQQYTELPFLLDIDGFKGPGIH